MTNAELVRRLWHAIDTRDWVACASFCAVDLTYALPQSGESHKRGNYLRLNREYPGDWRVSIDHLVDGGDWIVTEVTVTFPDHRDRGVSLFRCENALIAEIREYWPEPFPVPEWRKQWNLEEETNSE